MKVKSLLVIAALSVAAPAFADVVRNESVQFETGASGTTINASIKGDDSVQYSLNARAGQKMSVQLDSKNSSTYFNITAPGADAALYNSSINGNGTTVTVPSSGNYVINVYLMRNAARRGETSEYALTVYIE